MPYDIQFTPDAQEQIACLTARQRTVLLDAIEQQLLCDSPAQETRQRKKLRPNPLAPWELRIGEYRVFFDIYEHEQAVLIVAVGRKEHNLLYIGGRRFEL